MFLLVFFFFPLRTTTAGESFFCFQIIIYNIERYRAENGTLFFYFFLHSIRLLFRTLSRARIRSRYDDKKYTGIDKPKRNMGEREKKKNTHRRGFLTEKLLQREP